MSLFFIEIQINSSSLSLKSRYQILSKIYQISSVQFSSVQLLSHVRLFAAPVTAWQASLSITNSQSSPKLMSIESMMPSSLLILCRPLLLLPPIPPSIRVFSNESTLLTRWPKYWSFSFSLSPSNEHPGLISFRMDWLDLLSMSSILNNSKVYNIENVEFSENMAHRELAQGLRVCSMHVWYIYL